MRRGVIPGILIFMLMAQVNWGQIPETISYQGLLTDAGGSSVTDGSYDLTFSLYESDTGGSALWTETHASVAVINGVFGVILGSVDPVGNPLDLAFDQQYWLGVQIDGGAELAPRIPLTSVPYSLNARSVAPGAVTGDAIADGEVVHSLNGMTDDITLAEGTNITITPGVNTLTISAAFDGWSLTGNAGTNPTANFLGTTDDQPLELRVFGARVLRLEPHATSPNIIGGFSGNWVSPGIFGATICGGGNSLGNNRVTDVYGTVSGGTGNQAGDNSGTTEDAQYATVSGGLSNKASGLLSTVGGGGANQASGGAATVGGGGTNQATGKYSTIGGGQSNAATADYATIAGGGSSSPGNPNTANRVTDNYGTVSGGADNQAGDGDGNTEDVEYATVGGGESNQATEHHATVGGGWENEATARYATVGGGESNQAIGHHTTVGGGSENEATDIFATVGGGESNEATHYRATVGGGSKNQATASYATVGGGSKNQATASYATVPGGTNNTASGDYSFAAGRRAKLYGDGSFMWADSTDADFYRTNSNRFYVRSSNGVYLYTSGDLTSGAYLGAGATSWNTISDRASKRNIRQIDVREVLSKLTEIPISRWSYRTQDPEIEHIGPMAQDFYAAFGLGVDDKHINTIDPDGVALAAIQGLYELMQEKDAQIATQQEQIMQLEARLAALEARGQ